jgi:hypothetical protein
LNILPERFDQFPLDFDYSSVFEIPRILAKSAIFRFCCGNLKKCKFFLNVWKCEFWFSVLRPTILSALSTIELTCIKLFAQVLCFVVLILKSILSDGFCLCIQHHNIAVLLCAVVNVAALLRAAVNGNITLSQHHDMTTSHDITLSHDIT